MAPIGPRLDRPSAVGDEGRPRATSLGLASVVVVGVALAVGAALGDPRYFVGYALLGGLTVAGMALLDRDRTRQTVVGHLCFLPAACALLFAVVLSSTHWLVAVGTVAALLGVASAWADVSTADDVRQTLVSSFVSYVFGIVALVILGIALLLVLGLWELLTELAGGTDPAGSLLGLLVVVGVVCACLSAALWVLPVRQLAPRDREAEIERRVGRLLRRLVLGTIAAFALAVYAAVFSLASALDPVTSLRPVSVALDALTSRVVLTPLVVAAVLAVAVTVVTVGVRRATAEYGPRASRFVAAALGACGYLAVLVALGLSMSALGVRGLVGLLFVAPFVPVAIYAGLLLLFLVVRLGVVPDEAAPLAVAAAGLVCVAVGAASAGAPAVVVFAAVGGALVIWDVGSFGLGVTAELGHVPETRRLELYHGVFAVLVAAVAVALATGLEAGRRSLAAGIGAPEAMAVAAVGVVLLLVPLRG